MVDTSMVFLSRGALGKRKEWFETITAKEARSWLSPSRKAPRLST
jgi:hypothetical protein